MHDLNNIFNKTRLAKLLTVSLSDHKKIEKEFVLIISKYFSKKEQLDFPALKLGFLEYFSKNIFSILILSILNHLNISKRNRYLYGLIMHAVRGIVTSGDNILDQEDKGHFFVKMKGGRVLSNIFSVILETCVINEKIGELSPEHKDHIFKQLMEALFVIADEESVEENTVSKILHPDRVLKDIHHFRGGKLLELAFVVPEINEPHIDFSGIKEGIYQIGLAVQILDDITDFKIDYTDRNTNLLHSWIIHYQKDKKMTEGQFQQLMEHQLIDLQKAPVLYIFHNVSWCLSLKIYAMNVSESFFEIG